MVKTSSGDFILMTSIFNKPSNTTHLGPNKTYLEGERTTKLKRNMSKETRFINNQAKIN